MMAKRWIAAALLASAAASAQASRDWRMAPLASGSWLFRSVPGLVSEARFATSSQSLLIVRCDRTRRAITIHHARGPGDSVLVVTTSSLARSLPARPDRTSGAVAILSADDPLLDAIAFSRGRFAVHSASGGVIVPAAPEIARSIEDCRNG